MYKQSKIVDLLLNNRIVYHTLFWIFFLFLYVAVDGLNSGDFRTPFIKYSVMMPAQILAAYSVSYYLTPRLWFKGKYITFIITFLFSIYIFTAMARWSMVHIAEPFIRTDFQQESLWEILGDPFYLLGIYFPGIYLLVFIFYALKNVKARLEEKHLIELLEKEKANAELNFLKAQIHPHFLFNTLNNLYGLALENSPKVPDVVLKLSDILDYLLYQCAAPRVALKKELELLENYIELERLRYGEKLDLLFDHNITDSQAAIAPHILLSLLENAFKHGVRGNKAPVLKIKCWLEEKDLYFEVFNNKPEIPVQSALSENNGIGAKNLRRQLDLLYGKNYKLEVSDLPLNYFVSLVIPLS